MLIEEEAHDYTQMGRSMYREHKAVVEPTEQSAERALKDLRQDSATGPDGVPTKILKECAKELSRLFCVLAKKILAEGRWPEKWTTHWVVPLQKKKTMCFLQIITGRCI